MGGGGGAKLFHPLGGGGGEQFYPVLMGGGGVPKSFGPPLFPFHRPPRLPAINDQSLINWYISRAVLDLFHMVNQHLCSAPVYHSINVS